MGHGIDESVFSLCRSEKIVFIEDVGPLMFSSNYYLMPKFIEYYNRADVLIAPSPQLIDRLKQEGLADRPVVYQQFWDHLVMEDFSAAIPANTHRLNFAGNPDKFAFVKEWSGEVKLHVYAAQRELANPNLVLMGWHDGIYLLNSLRQTGGLGLVWADDPYMETYTTMNAPYKLSTYLAAGMPVVVKNNLAQAEFITQQKLGICVDNLAEAAEKAATISDDEYTLMQRNVEQVGKLIRKGYFTKRALINAVMTAQLQPEG